MNYVREYWSKIESGEIVTSRRVKANIISPLFHDRPELRALLDHVYGFGERLFRLIAFCGDGVYLRRALVICNEQIERDRRE